jgi:Ras-related protein Rab-5C
MKFVLDFDTLCFLTFPLCSIFETLYSIARRKIAQEEAEQYAQENGILHLVTSAKDGLNVKSLFVEIAKRLPKDLPVQEREAFPITAQQNDRKSCC